MISFKYPQEIVIPKRANINIEREVPTWYGFALTYKIADGRQYTYYANSYEDEKEAIELADYHVLKEWSQAVLVEIQQTHRWE